MNTTVLASVISGLAGVVASYVGIQWKTKKDLEAKFDASLRALRLQAYPPLWGFLKPLALFGRDGYPGINDLVTLSKSLRDWYFDQGGSTSRGPAGTPTSGCSDPWECSQLQTIGVMSLSTTSTPTRSSIYV